MHSLRPCYSLFNYFNFNVKFYPQLYLYLFFFFGQRVQCSSLALYSHEIYENRDVWEIATHSVGDIVASDTLVYYTTTYVTSTYGVPTTNSSGINERYWRTGRHQKEPVSQLVYSEIPFVAPASITTYVTFLMKRGIGENANAFKRFRNAFERVLIFPYSPFHQEGHI